MILVSSINYYKYNYFGITDFKGSAFKSALSESQRVIIEKEERYIPVSDSKRQLLYKISPTFNELKIFLEDPKNNWIKVSCDQYPPSCGDFGAGWYMWAFRQATQSSGHYSNAKDAEAFYKKIGTEIHNACEIGAVKCRANLIAFIPLLPENFLKLFSMALYKSILATIMYDDKSLIHVDSGESSGPEETLNKIKFFVL